MIYFLKREDGLIKIGTTTEFYRRLKELNKQYGELEILAWQVGDREVEKGLHKQFKSSRVVDEWFYPVEGLLKYIEKNTVTSPPPLPASDLSTEQLIQSIRERDEYIKRITVWAEDMQLRLKDVTNAGIDLAEIGKKLHAQLGAKDLTIKRLEEEIVRLNREVYKKPSKALKCIESIVQE